MKNEGPRGNGWRVGVALAGFAFLGWNALGGCSYLYDTDELPGYVPPDAALPVADENALTLTALAAAPGLEEGFGDSGSRPALLVIEGADISRDTTIEIVGQDADGKDVAIPGLTLGEVKTGKLNDFLATTVSVAASAELAGNVDVPLTVRISKRNGAGERIFATAPWVLKGRFELDKPGTITGEGVAKPYIYSKVDVSGALTVRGSDVLVIRSNSSFRVTGNFDLSANKQLAGFARGVLGGDAAKVGQGISGGVGGAGGVGNDGGGGGYATAGNGGAVAAAASGDAQISSFATNGSSGGGGGGVLGLLGGVGGGGGGAIELSARGELTVGNVSSNGGEGTPLLGLGDGGGGSGGTIILRGGTKVTAGNLLALGGRGGDPANLGAANAGAPGRIRIDTAEVGGGASVPLAVRGAMFDPATPLIVTKKTLPLKIISVPGTRFDLHSLDAAGQSAPGQPTLVDFQGAPEVTVSVDLRIGYNRLCTTPQGSTVSRSESTNCIEVAFIESRPAE